MEALGWGWNWSPLKSHHSGRRRNSKSSDSVDGTIRAGYTFPLKQALTAGSLALTGDAIAQLSDRWRKAKVLKEQEDRTCSDSDGFSKDVIPTSLTDHDWFRAIRLTSYGFLFYGPGSYAWYQFLDRCLPNQTVGNVMLKVLLNQIILGPCVIAVVFAWNNLLQGKLLELPNKYQKDALPTLLYGFRFWIPVSALNFWLVPLQGRVAFMSMGSIFWNFCLSTTMSK